MNLAVEITLIILLVILNGVFALSEIAIVSSRKPRLQHLANKGNHRAKVALDLANAPDHFLSTVQAGITLVGILAGAFGGATLSESVAVYLSAIPSLAAYAEPVSLALVVVSITYLSLIIGELIPKQLALKDPERVACMIAIPMHTLSTVMHPIVRFLTFSTNILIRTLGIKDSLTPTVTEEEIKVMLEEGTKAGTFNEVEQEMVERVFRLADLSVNALMTPRTEIVWLDTEDSIEENFRKIRESSHSFFPVCTGSIDNVLGVVHVKDLFSASLNGPVTALQQHLRTPLYIVENVLAVQLIERFKESGTHFAFLVDEYGGIQGLLTLNDILKAVVGEEIDTNDRTNPYIVQRADGSYLVDGALLIDEFRELFNIDSMSDDDTGNYQTVAGFVINQMGRIPRAGQLFRWRDLTIEVMDMDGNRVDKLLISKRQPAS
ncbi:MAG: HlyC/CorC family transporter [Bacteroidetes bacterium]|nr:HlyC/CorC family transporter [Bacteroidota bacterium]